MRIRMGLAGLVVLSLAISSSVLFAGRAAGSGQPGPGFSEATAGEAFQVMGSDYSVRPSLQFTAAELVRVNVTSDTVDWLADAAGGGARALILQRFDGSTVASAVFAQTDVGLLHVYSASFALAPLALSSDAYYLRIFIDDTVSTFEAISTIRVGAVGIHGIETYTDDTFAHASDVFTSTSMIWVKVVGSPNEDPDRWDIFEFVDGASAVGGPRGGFADFQRVGDTYTFSIDLTNFPGPFVSGWSYTLWVRLTNGAFDAGKQIQIFDPTLTIAATDIAPAQARQGQTDVPVLALSASLNPNWDLALGPAAFNLERIRVTFTGSGVPTNVATVKVWEDANSNGVLDAGDSILASAANVGGLPSPVWVGTNGVGMTAVESSAPRNLLVTLDIAPTAVVGSTIGARIAGPAEIDMAGRFSAINGLPAQSSNIQITAASVLTMTNDPGIAPGNAVRGEPDVAVDLLDLSTNGAVITVHNVSVDLAGTGTGADIARVSLRVDDGDGAYAPATDPVLGTPTTFPASGPAVFRNLGLAVDATGRSVWIVYDIAPAATIGNQVGSRIASNASVDVSGGSVFGGTFPLESGLVAIRGPTLTVSGASVAPAQARPGRANVPMLRLTLSLDATQGTVTGLRVDKRGTSVFDSDVSLAKLWRDDGDGLFDLGDSLLGQQAFVGGTTVIGGFNLPVTEGTDSVVFVTFDISGTATLGVTVSARLGGPAYVSVDPDVTVDGANFPIASAGTMIVPGGPGAILTVGSVDLAAATPQAYQGQADVAMEKLILAADANQATVMGLRIDRRGTSTSDADVAAVNLYRDADGDGNLTSGDVRLGSTTFVGGVAVLGGLNVVVTAPQPVVLFIAFDIASSATVGASLGVRLASPTYVSVDANSTVDPASFPIRSSEVTVLAEPLGTISGTVSDAAGNPLAGATVEIPALGRTTTTDAQGAYLFADLPLGSYYVIVRNPGYLAGNQTAVLTAGSPSKVLTFVLDPAPTGGPSFLLWIGAGLVGLLALGGILFLWARRRSTCPVCGKRKPRDRPVCGECEAKGLRPPQGPTTMPPDLPPPP